jgi:hypothetical protein
VPTVIDSITEARTHKEVITNDTAANVNMASDFDALFLSQPNLGNFITLNNSIFFQNIFNIFF